MTRLDVAAVIPNYNMADSLHELLPSLLEQEYAGVFVLDDASTDHSRDVVQAFGRDVTFVGGDVNVGAAGNRNRIIGHLDSGIIHFIDADMILDTPRVPEIAPDLMRKPSSGIVGGLVKDLDGTQFGMNYGPKLNALAALASPLQLIYANRAKTDPESATRLRERAGFLLRAWPDVTVEPVAHETYWVSEANMLVDAALFSRVHGFNPKLRFHDIQDLAMKFDQLGVRRYFDPTIEATHKAIQVRKQRQIEFVKAYARLVGSYGLRQLI